MVCPQLSIAVLALIFASYNNKLNPNISATPKLLKPIQHDTQKKCLIGKACTNLFRNPTKLRHSDSFHGNTFSSAAENTSSKYRKIIQTSTSLRF